MAPHLAVISAEARKIYFTRTILSVFAAIFFGLGWLLCHVVTWTWLSIAWSMAAMKVGWKSAQAHSAPKPPLPPQEAVLRENTELRQTVQALRNDLASLQGGRTVRA